MPWSVGLEAIETLGWGIQKRRFEVPTESTILKMETNAVERDVSGQIIEVYCPEGTLITSSNSLEIHKWGVSNLESIILRRLVQ